MHFQTMKIGSYSSEPYDNYSFRRCYYASMLMLDKLRQVKPVITPELIKVYCTEQQMSYMWYTSDEDLSIVGSLYKKPIEMFVYDQTVNHLSRILDFWAKATYSRTCYINQNSLDTLIELNTTFIRNNDKDSFFKLVNRFNIELKNSSILSGNRIVVPRRVALSFIDRMIDRLRDIQQSTPEYRLSTSTTLNKFIDLIETVVLLHFNTNWDVALQNNWGTERDFIQIFDEAIKDTYWLRDKLSLINGKSNLSLPAAICMDSPLKDYFITDNRSFNNSSDSIMFLRANILFTTLLNRTNDQYPAVYED